MAAAASEGASSGDANDDAGPGRCAWEAALGEPGGARGIGGGPWVSRVVLWAALGGTRGDDLLGRAASVVSDTNS